MRRLGATATFISPGLAGSTYAKYELKQSAWQSALQACVKNWREHRTEDLLSTRTRVSMFVACGGRSAYRHAATHAKRRREHENMRGYGDMRTRGAVGD
eukprot:3763304-Prymnesium_polylepis.2